MDWHNIDTAPTDGRYVSLVIQFADESDQRIEPCVRFDPDVGGTVFFTDGSMQSLSEVGEWATHWGEPIQMPPVVVDFTHPE